MDPLAILDDQPSDLRTSGRPDRDGLLETVREEIRNDAIGAARDQARYAAGWDSLTPEDQARFNTEWNNFVSGDSGFRTRTPVALGPAPPVVEFLDDPAAPLTFGSTAVVPESVAAPVADIAGPPALIEIFDQPVPLAPQDPVSGAPAPLAALPHNLTATAGALPWWAHLAALGSLTLFLLWRRKVCVVFHPGTGEDPYIVYIKRGQRLEDIDLPETVGRVGAKIEGWYADAAHTAESKWGFETKVRTNMDLHAKWPE